MPTQDISRYLNQPAKHYATVQLQQGRVILDSDWNERAMAEAEDLRATLLDITCSHGTPNDGYEVNTIDPSASITPPEGVAFPTYNFTVAAGSFYIGGLRVVLEADTSFLGQKDWLQINSDSANLPARVLVTGPDRRDIAYLRIWEQTVSATEDMELLEPALGGRDTSVRVRRMQRIEVKTGITATDCAAAFTELTASLAVGATFNDATGELVSDATLTVSPSGTGVVEDPCAEPVGVTGGYVGANNQAIRVELRGDDTLIWGYDNAAPLYRVTVDSGNAKRLIFLTEPADLPSMAREGQIIELLQWGARLDNGQLVAERQGELRRVATTYDPETKALLLDDDVPSTWVTWLAQNSVGGEDEFLFLRLWDQGDTLISAPALPADLVVDYSLGTVELGSIGLAVDIPSGTGRAGDYWIIAARPSTPERVSPWELLTAASPHGPREFYAPLALIDFDTNDPDPIVTTVVDCRLKMRPLCEGGCCKVTVGDDKHSFGQVNSLQEAITLLGTTGGKICLLPGDHIGTAEIDGTAGANDIIIEGCGPRSRLMTTAPSTAIAGVTDNFAVFYDPVLRIVDAARVQVRDLRIDAHSAIGVSIVQTSGHTCEEISIDNVQVFATGRINVPDSVLELAAPCIAVLGASRVDIIDCEVGVDNVASLSSAIVLGGEQLRLHRTQVIAAEWDGVELRALGGVQVRSGSVDVEIVGCEISGGWGHGISLGHAGLYSRADPPASVDQHEARSTPPGGESYLNVTLKWDCIEPDVNGAQASSDDQYVWLPMGPVEQVRIYDNVIRNMGLSGISTSLFFSSNYNWDTSTYAPVFIVAIDIDIARNLIEENVKLTKLPESFSYFFDVCVGGICLAASICATIRENQILRNGADLMRVPVCGIGLVAAQAATIEDNRIVGNGAQLVVNSSSTAPTETNVVRGLRGGIAIWEITSLLGDTFATQVSQGPVLPAAVTDLSSRTTESALVVRGNEVSQPLGKALWVRRGFGPIAVTGNTFESFGDPVDGIGLVGVGLRWSHGTAGSYTRPARGACVEVINLGLALDVDWSSVVDPPPPTPLWVDTSSTSISRGDVTFTGNTMSLEWSVLGGHAASVVVSSLGSVMYNSNVNSVVTNNAYGDTISPIYVGEPIRSLFEQVISGNDAMSFVLTSTYIGAASAAQACTNRSEEGKFDALFSLIVGPALAPGDDQTTTLRHVAMGAGNIGTHCTAVDLNASNTVYTPNIAVYPHETIGCDLLVTANAVGGVRIITISNDTIP